MVAGARDTTNVAAPAQITADNKFVLALTYAPMSEFERARREKKRPAEQPKASLAIVDLSNGQVTSVTVGGTNGTPVSTVGTVQPHDERITVTKNRDAHVLLIMSILR